MQSVIQLVFGALLGMVCDDEEYCDLFRRHRPGRRNQFRRSANERLQTVPCRPRRPGHEGRTIRTGRFLRCRSRFGVRWRSFQDWLDAVACGDRQLKILPKWLERSTVVKLKCA